MFGKPKMLVEILDETGIKSRRKYPLDGNTVIIRREQHKRGRPQYAPSFTKRCIVPYFVGVWPFKRLKQKLMLKDGADSCIEFYKAEEYQVEVPEYTRTVAEKVFEAGAVKNAGATVQKVQVPFVLYAIIGIVIVLQIVQFLVSSGRMRFV